MQINGSLPLHIARAYGVDRVASPPAAPPAPPVAKPDTASISSSSSLVGGRVSEPVEFDSATAANAPGAMALYTRAADRIEAAVTIQVGRSIDVRG